jgi:hypothetical protein
MSAPSVRVAALHKENAESRPVPAVRLRGEVDRLDVGAELRGRRNVSIGRLVPAGKGGFGEGFRTPAPCGTVVRAVGPAFESLSRRKPQGGRALVGRARPIGIWRSGSAGARHGGGRRRSDAYDARQSTKGLEGLRQVAFSLSPMPRGAYQEVTQAPLAGQGSQQQTQDRNRALPVPFEQRVAVPRVRKIKSATHGYS